MKIKFLKANNGDSILISLKDNNGHGKNILIDGGTTSTYFDSRYNTYGALKDEIEGIRGRKEKIDLLILSHIDNDHIEGLLKWFSKDENAHELVSSVWFNSGKSISNYFKEESNKDLRVDILSSENTYTGVPEALEFEEYLLKHKIWDRKLIQKGNVTEVFGVSISVLTPTNAQLKRLVREYKKKTGDVSYTGGKAQDWDLDIKALIERESKEDFRFVQDKSIKNGSSISMLLTYQDDNFLFLADSHPKEVLQSLNELGYSKENPVEVELFQISHHGSKANMSKDLLEIVKTDNYVISTDSSSHGHPHKATLARIINVNPNATIHFNYAQVRKNILKTEDFEDYPNIKTRLISEYPTN